MTTILTIEPPRNFQLKSEKTRPISSFLEIATGFFSNKFDMRVNQFGDALFFFSLLQQPMKHSVYSQ